MSKNKNKHRFDLYVQHDNAITIINWCKRHGVSVNSFFNHLLVSFLLNRDKFTFTFADGNQRTTINDTDDISNDDIDCFPEILKRIAEDDDYDF